MHQKTRVAGFRSLTFLFAFALLAALAAFSATAAPAPDQQAADQAEAEHAHGDHAEGHHARGHRAGPRGEALTEEQRAEMKERAEARAAGRFAAIARRLELTDAQKAGWKETLQAHHESQRAERETFGELSRELRAEVDSESPNATRVGELTLALREHREVARQSRDELNAELRSLLTREQAEKFDQMQARRGQHGEHGRRHGPRGRRHGGGGGQGGNAGNG